MQKKKLAASLFVAGTLASPLAMATNGYFPLSYGVKSEGMGGVGIALPQDTLAAAINPAGMVRVGDRADVGATLFRPNRSATVGGNTYSGNGKANFVIPDLGYNKMISNDTSLGVAIYGNGGMNTQYDTNMLGGAGPLGINLAQLFISPTWSRKINDTNSIGIAINFAYQMFSATGLQAFQGFSSSPGNMTNNGTDTSTGVGLRLGWTGDITPQITLGAMYQPKTKMSKFSKYAGLFADQGSFDIPATYGVGVAYKATPQITTGLDITQIKYSGVSSVSNSSSIPLPYGSSGGPGFGWKDMTVFKLGVAYQYEPDVTLRAGFNHNNQQIGSNDAFLNLLAPGVVQNHLTLGGTWKLANKSELSVAYIHAFSQTVSGPNPFGGTASIKMSEDSIGVMYGW